MKYVREHINEKFEEKSDPIDDMGIGYLVDLQKRFSKMYTGIPFSKLTSNQLLMVGVQHAAENVEVQIEVVKLALKHGADQLWYPSERSQIYELVQITGVGEGGWRDDNPKITFKRIWSSTRGTDTDQSKKSSTQFYSKYHPVTTSTLKELDEQVKHILNVKQSIISLNTKIEDEA